jgi:AcrR family transcriptional regulator
MTPPSDSHAPDPTRQRLIEIAGPIFADRGYEATTIKEITDQAKLNVASVNYHFRDKMGLYLEVLRQGLPVYGHVASDGPPLEALEPEARLRAFVSLFLRTLLVAGRPGWISQIMCHEMSRPTAAFAQVIQEIVRPKLDHAGEIVAALLDAPRESEQVRMAAHSLLAQCVHWVRSREALALLWPEMDLSDPSTVERVAAHICAFSLGGIRALKDFEPHPAAGLPHVQEFFWLREKELFGRMDRWQNA